MDDIILKRFENPDEVRTFEKGKFEVINLGGMTIGRATYQPGWKWSVDVSPLSGTDFCEVEHLGMVISGQATCAFKDGDVHTMKPGDLWAKTPRQLGGWGRGICLFTLSGYGQIRRLGQNIHFLQLFW